MLLESVVLLCCANFIVMMISCDYECTLSPSKIHGDATNQALLRAVRLEGVPEYQYQGRQLQVRWISRMQCLGVGISKYRWALSEVVRSRHGEAYE